MPRPKSYELDDVTEKAMFTFWKNGYEATTWRMLEKEMGINQFSIHSSFKSKKALFTAVLKMYKSYIEKQFLRKLLSPDNELEDIEEFLKTFADAIQSGKIPNGCLMVNTTAEISPRDKELFAIVESYFVVMRNIFKSVLINAQKKEKISAGADLDQYANYLLGIAQGITVMAKMQNKNQIEDYIQMAMKTIN